MEEQFYIIKYPGGEFVALDDASGGYPYQVERICSAERFKSAEDADRYRQIGKNRERFTIHKATLTLSTEQVEVKSSRN